MSGPSADLTLLRDEQVDAAYEQLGKEVGEATKRWAPFVLEQLRRFLLAHYPQAAKVRFVADHNADNGPFLALGTILDAAGEEIDLPDELDDPEASGWDDEAFHTLEALLADLTFAYGSDEWDGTTFELASGKVAAR